MPADSQDAINLYNFKQGSPASCSPRQKRARGRTLFGQIQRADVRDYYWYYERHQDQISSTRLSSRGSTACGSGAQYLYGRSVSRIRTMSPIRQSPFTTWIFDGEWYRGPAVRLGPNLELVRYASDPDSANFPGRRQDSIFHVTFFWTF
jgi:hypothetical protein